MGYRSDEEYHYWTIGRRKDFDTFRWLPERRGVKKKIGLKKNGVRGRKFKSEEYLIRFSKKRFKTKRSTEIWLRNHP